MIKNGLKLFLCVVLTLGVGGVSGYFTANGISTWYVFLSKPSFNPPNYLFGPVWTILYFLMGISFYRVIKKSKLTDIAIWIFILQLSLNFFWSFIFFNFHQLGFALLEIILLWFSILYMIVLFYKIDKWASIINIPYLFWVSFATLLNFSIYILN